MTRPLAAPPEEVERAILGPSHGEALRRSWPDLQLTLSGSVGPSDPVRDIVEMRLRCQPTGTSARIRRGWLLELIYTRPARRMEYVLVPEDAPLAPWAINKGQITLHPTSGGHTDLCLEGRTRCRVPGLRRWLEPKLEGEATRLFVAWASGLDEIVSEGTSGEA